MDAILSYYITCNILLEFLMWTALFWDFTQHRLAVCYQHFGTSYESHLQGWSSTHLYWEWCGQWLVLREHDASNRVTAANRRWKGLTKLSCLGVLCGKRALENEVTAKGRKEWQKGKKKKRRKTGGKKRQRKRKTGGTRGITNRFMEGGGGEYAGQPRALKKSGTGEWNQHYSVGQGQRECCPQKDHEVVTTPKEAVFIYGCKWQVSMTHLKSDHPPCWHCWVQLQLICLPAKFVYIAIFGTENLCVLEFYEVIMVEYMFHHHQFVWLWAGCAGSAPLLWSWWINLSVSGTLPGLLDPWRWDR